MTDETATGARALPASADDSILKCRKYVKGIVALLAFSVLLKTLKLAGDPSGDHYMIDFDAFYLVGRMVWRGEAGDAYHLVSMLAAQLAYAGRPSFMPWTYPPQFDLVVAPLALLPRALAYLLFAGSTLALYLVTLRRIAGEAFGLVLAASLPALLVTISCGQNGLLTGALIGLVCLGLQAGRRSAGLPLGLMVIKPHLAVVLGAYVVLTRRWAVAMIAVAIVAASTILVTLLFGPGIWRDFVHGVGEARAFLAEGQYPLFRMISVYAASHTFGAPPAVALGLQVAGALAALAVTGLAAWGLFTMRQALGLLAISSLMISPYAYDYDLPILGVGLAFLAVDLVRGARRFELVAIFGLASFAGLYGFILGMLTAVLFDHTVLPPELQPTAYSGLAMAVLYVLAVRVILRQRPRPAGSGAVSA